MISGFINAIEYSIYIILAVNFVKIWVEIYKTKCIKYNEIKQLNDWARENWHSQLKKEQKKKEKMAKKKAEQDEIKAYDAECE